MWQFAVPMWTPGGQSAICFCARAKIAICSRPTMAIWIFGVYKGNGEFWRGPRPNVAKCAEIGLAKMLFWWTAKRNGLANCCWWTAKKGLANCLFLVGRKKWIGKMLFPVDRPIIGLAECFPLSAARKLTWQFLCGALLTLWTDFLNCCFRMRIPFSVSPTL